MKIIQESTEQTKFNTYICIALNDFWIICLSNILPLNVSDEGYSRHDSCALGIEFDIYVFITR